MSNNFSTKRIKYLLKAKIYEKHNLSKTEYINLCREKWGDSEGAKVIVDKLYPISLLEAFKKAGYHLDHALEIFLKQRDSEITNDQQEIISCYKIHLLDDTGNIINISKLRVSYPNYWSDKSVKEGTYFLAYFDVLGFTNLVESKRPIEVFKIYENILKKARINKPYLVLQKDVEGLQETFDDGVTDEIYSLPILTKVPFKFAYYSDTILFWSPGDINYFSGFVAKCIDYYNMALKNKVLLRGVITHGEAILNKKKNIFIGEPIIEAANLEKEQKWSGVIFGDSIYKKKLFNHLDSQLIMCGCAFHMKCIVKGKIFHVAMNWMSRLNINEIKEAFEILKIIKYDTSGKGVDYLNNTMRFISFYLSCLELDNNVRDQFIISLSFPSEIKESLYEVRTKKDFIFRLVYLELIDGRFFSGFLFVAKPEAFEINPSLKEILLFVELENMVMYGKLLLSEIETLNLKKFDWINYIPITKVKNIYS